jgi:class 3 adenylate cyclase
METRTVDAKHIFIDIVNYTYQRSVEAQTDLISYLNAIVSESVKHLNIAEDDVIFIPTGDGMCISLINVLTPFDIHIVLALEILSRIEKHNSDQKDKMRQFHIRIGINENIDNLIIDINGRRNISGAGINFAARIEGLCDESQICVGESVYDKLAQREKYMGFFNSYSAAVKHGVPLKIYQYVDKTKSFLNSDIPSKFQPKIVDTKGSRLTQMQAFYIANCICNEGFITQNIGHGLNNYSLRVLMYQLSEDLLSKSSITKSRPTPSLRVQRPMQEQFNYLQKIDFYVICDFDSSLRESLYGGIYNCFSEAYLFVNEYGKNKLLQDHPDIAEQFGIEQNVLS